MNSTVMSLELKLQLVAIYSKGSPLKVRRYISQRQQNDYCLMYALCNMHDFCLDRRISASKHIFDEGQMGKHLIACLEGGKFSKFPTMVRNWQLARQSTQYKEFTIRITRRSSYFTHPKKKSIDYVDLSQCSDSENSPMSVGDEITSDDITSPRKFMPSKPEPSLNLHDVSGIFTGNDMSDDDPDDISPPNDSVSIESQKVLITEKVESASGPIPTGILQIVDSVDSRLTIGVFKYVNCLFKHQYPDEVHGFQSLELRPVFDDSTQMWSYDNMFLPAQASSPYVQFHVSKGEYLVSFRKKDQSIIYIFDSNNLGRQFSKENKIEMIKEKLTIDIQLQLSAIYGTRKDKALKVICIKTTSNKNIFNSGVFAIANMIQICENGSYCGSLDPLKQITYDEDTMRGHLKMCLKSGKLSSFPLLDTRYKPQTSLKNSWVFTLSTSCRACPLIDAYDDMIQCWRCSEWFHYRCAGIDDSSKRDNVKRTSFSYVCNRCLRSDRRSSSSNSGSSNY